MDDTFQLPAPMSEGQLEHILTKALRVHDSIGTLLYNRRYGVYDKESLFRGTEIFEFPHEERCAMQRAQLDRFKRLKVRQRTSFSASWVDCFKAIWVNAAYKKDYLLPTYYTLGFRNIPRACKCLKGTCSSRTENCEPDREIR